MKKEVIKFLFIFLVVIIFFMGMGFGLFRYYSRELPPLSELQSYEMKVGSEVYDRNDNLIHISVASHPAALEIWKDIAATALSSFPTGRPI